MIKFKQVVPAVAALGLTLAVSLAHAAPVGVSGFSFAPGAGYGVDTGPNPENGGTLLDVVFGNGFTAQSLALDAVGSTASFVLGTVNFREPDTGNGSNKGIRDHETNALGVTASLVFGAPSGATINLIGTGTAVTGEIDDAGVDYTLAWAPTEVDFGIGGRFGITLNTLSFTNVGTKTLSATVTMLAAARAAEVPPPAAQAVPEPASLALAALALAGAGLARRRRMA